MKRPALIAGLLAAAVIAAALLFIGIPQLPMSESVRTQDRVEQLAPTSARQPASAQHPPGRAADSGEARSKDELTRSERARVRERILAAARAREAVASRPGFTPEPEPERPPGDLTKRIEGHDALLGELNHDFMPLADECIEQALELDPELEGMLAFEFEIVVEEELGAVIDAVSFPDQNQIEQPELQTCVRESLLSMVLPAGSESSRQQLMLTLPINPADAN